ncbi:YkvA family protein [Marinobacter gelidimuriae]|uniref:YkvA family protein n=1 Tax=Marinobacter gelidimuriae TaxID=2739064 RepID=UPI00036F9448|nr:YkvA family protein [Marinobacter gelidimuriae]
MAFISERTARRQLESESDKVKQADLQRLLEKQQAVEEKVKNSGKLDRFTTDIKLMFSLVRDYYNGRYRSIPWKSIAAIVGALVYVLNPLDLIPDLILSIGFVDDVGVVALCLKLVESDLHRYAAWKELQDAG